MVASETLDRIQERAGIPDDQVIMICVAVGWPDDSFAANAVISNRKSVGEAVVSVGFDTWSPLEAHGCDGAGGG